jgi:hypothetical protein
MIKKAKNERKNRSVTGEKSQPRSQLHGCRKVDHVCEEGRTVPGASTFGSYATNLWISSLRTWHHSSPSNI